MNAYSKDLRVRVLAAVDRGMPRKEVVRTFGVSIATIGRYLRRRREGMELAPKPSTGRTPTILANLWHKRALWKQLEDNDTATLERHCELWEEREGVKVSISTMSRAIRKLGWSRKKDRWAPSERDEQARSAFREYVKLLDWRDLVFVDESGTNITLAPLYGWAPKGERAYGKAPRNWDKNITLIASLSAEGIGAAMSVEGATDGAAFQTYVKHFLVPTLKTGQIVVLDNLQVHKSLKVRELIEGAGASVLFLPSYSPDFSPIEGAFSKVKNLVRKAQARTQEALIEAIGDALDAVSRRDALGFFEHCGYHADGQLL
jgi:transposase